MIGFRMLINSYSCACSPEKMLRRNSTESDRQTDSGASSLEGNAKGSGSWLQAAGGRDGEEGGLCPWDTAANTLNPYTLSAQWL